MPIYEYRCEHCGERTEILVSRVQATPPSCFACGSDRVARLPSRFSVRGVPSAPGSVEAGGCCGGGCSCGRGT